MANDIVTYASDLDVNLDLDGQGYLKVKINEQTINDQIIFLFTTFRGEMLFNPSLGNSLEEQLFEFPDVSINLIGTLTDLLKSSIPYINPTVNIYVDQDNNKQINFDVKYTINNDPNIGKQYQLSGTI